MASLDEKIIQYEETFSVLKQKLKWKMADTRAIMMVASIYVVNGKKIDLNHYLELSDYIKRNVGMFSSLNSYQRFITAAMLDARFDEPHQKFHELLSLYHKLIEGGFRRGAFTYIAALVMLSEQTETTDRDRYIDRAFAVYQAMKKEHFFLTSDNDYPLAVLLASRDEAIAPLINRIEHFYGELNREGFWKGNDLQMLSHILSMDVEEQETVLIERCAHLFAAFKREGLKIKTMYYPELGMLALLKDGTAEIPTIKKVYEKLNNDRKFRWHKEINFVMAVNFVMSEKLDEASLLETGIYTTIETIIQAQNAAMTAAIASTTAAASSSSS